MLVQLQLWDRFTVQVLSKALDGTVLGVKSVSNPFYGTRFTQKTVQNCTLKGGFLQRPAKMNCPLLLVRESYITGGHSLLDERFEIRLQRYKNCTVSSTVQTV